MCLLLLDLGFLVHYMLAHDRVVLLELELVRRVLLLLVGRVVMTRPGGGDELDLVAGATCHDESPLNFLAGRAQICQHGVDAFLVDNAHSLGGEAQLHPAVLALNPETVAVQIGQRALLVTVIGVGNVVPDQRAFAGYLADSGHSGSSNLMTRISSGAAVVRPLQTEPVLIAENRKKCKTGSRKFSRFA